MAPVLKPAQQLVDDWNKQNPVGTVVLVRNDNNTCQQTRTRSEASVTVNGQAVIFLEGFSGYYLLSRVTPVPVRAFPDRQGNGMRVSAAGLISQVAGCVKKSDKFGHAWTLEQLLKHLQELGDRYYEGDESVVDEFLQLYSLDRKRQKP